MKLVANIQLKPTTVQIVALKQTLKGICNDSELSIWRLGGRQRSYICGERQRELLKHRKGEVDLMFVHGKWYVSYIPPPGKCKDVLGIDLGVVNLAFDNDGQSHSGGRLQENRRKYAHRRHNPQRRLLHDTLASRQCSQCEHKANRPNRSRAKVAVVQPMFSDCVVFSHNIRPETSCLNLFSAVYDNSQVDLRFCLLPLQF